jgi:NAD(P)-dependent dehydrogenase (short-subunit alcohol dehydrogenase family)
MSGLQGKVSAITGGSSGIGLATTVRGDVQNFRDLDRLYERVKEEKGKDRYSGCVRSFVRSWTAEFKDRGMRVNAISPGAIDTPIIDAQAATKEGADAIRESFKAATRLNRLGHPEEIAAAAIDSLKRQKALP